MSTTVRIGDLTPQAQHVYAPLLVANIYNASINPIRRNDNTVHTLDPQTFDPQAEVLRTFQVDSFADIMVNPIVTGTDFQPVLETFGMTPPGLRSNIASKAIVFFGSSANARGINWENGVWADMSIMSQTPSDAQHNPCRSHVYQANGSVNLAALDALPWDANNRLTQIAHTTWVDKQASAGWAIPVVGTVLNTFPARASKAEFGALFSALTFAHSQQKVEVEQSVFFGFTTRKVQTPFITREQLELFYTHPLLFWSNVLRTQLGQTVQWT